MKVIDLIAVVQTDHIVVEVDEQTRKRPFERVYVQISLRPQVIFSGNVCQEISTVNIQQHVAYGLQIVLNIRLFIIKITTQTQMRPSRTKFRVYCGCILAFLPQGEHIQQKELVLLGLAIEDYVVHVKLAKDIPHTSIFFDKTHLN